MMDSRVLMLQLPKTVAGIRLFDVSFPHPVSNT